MKGDTVQVLYATINHLFVISFNTFNPNATLTYTFPLQSVTCNFCLIPRLTKEKLNASKALHAL
jgi:hypothetical protein